VLAVSSGGGDGGVRGAGATYVRWGRKTCDSNTSLLYAGNDHRAKILWMILFNCSLTSMIIKYFD